MQTHRGSTRPVLRSTATTILVVRTRGRRILAALRELCSPGLSSLCHEVDQGLQLQLQLLSPGASLGWQLLLSSVLTLNLQILHMLILKPRGCVRACARTHVHLYRSAGLLSIYPLSTGWSSLSQAQSLGRLDAPSEQL